MAAHTRVIPPSKKDNITMKIVAVTGGRKYNNEAVVYKTLDGVLATYGDICIVEGGATGADRLCRYWAMARKVQHYTENADWKNLSHKDAYVKHGAYGPYDANAGARRNQKMIDQYKPTLLVAFPGGHGTANMKTLARKAGIKILEAQ